MGGVTRETFKVDFLLGQPGANGQPGATGPAGADGQSAYELAVEQGFVGTEAEWLESLKAATRGFWTPVATPVEAPAPFNPIFMQGNVALSNSNYTATGFSGYVFTGLGLPHDATLRGHTVALDVTGIANGEAIYLASLDGNDIGSATNGQGIILVWDSGNSRFDVMGGNIMVDTPTALGTLVYTNGQELAFGTDNSGTVSLYLDGVLQFTMTATTVMMAASVSFGVYIATGGPANLQATIVQTPAFPVPAITQYTTTTQGPISYPPDRAGKIFEVEGVAPGGIVVEGFRLKNGMWAEFDQTLALVPPLEPEVPFLTEAAADLLYSPLIANFYGQMAAPGPNDDSASIGAMVGSKWQDTSVSPNEWYICSSPSVGAAVWEKLSLTIDELGSMALQNSGSGPTEYRDNAAQDVAIGASAQSVKNSGGRGVLLISSASNYLASVGTEHIAYTGAGLLSNFSLPSSAVANDKVWLTNLDSTIAFIGINDQGGALILYGNGLSSSSIVGSGIRHACFTKMATGSWVMTERENF